MKVLFNPVQNANFFYQRNNINNKTQLNNSVPISADTPSFGKNNNAEYFSSLKGVSSISFQGFTCETGDFELKRVSGIMCPCCGKPMSTYKQQENFVERVSDKTGEQLQRELVKGLTYYRENEAELVHILIETSEEHPDMNLQELCRLQAKLNKKNLEQIQKGVLSEMENTLSGLNDTDKERMSRAINSAYKTIENSNDSYYFQTNQLKKKLKNIILASSDPNNETFNKLDQMINSMPNSYTSKDAFFTKYQRKSPQEIAARLYTPATASVEHIYPHTKGGADNSSNYILMCRDCNNCRDIIPYSKWLKMHPEMCDNLQKYLDQVSFIIKSRYFPGADKYVGYEKDVIKAFKKATGGELVLEHPSNKSKAAKKEANNIDAEFLHPTKENKRKQIEIEVEYILRCIEGRTEALKLYSGDEEFEKLREYTLECEKYKQLCKNVEASTAILSKLNQSLSKIKERIEQDGEKRNQQDLKLKKDLQEKIKTERRKFYAAKAESETQRRKISKLRYNIEMPEDITKKIANSNKIRRRINSIRQKINILKKEKKKCVKLKSEQEMQNPQNGSNNPNYSEDLITHYNLKIEKLRNKIDRLQIRELSSEEINNLIEKRKKITDMLNYTQAEEEIAELKVKLDALLQESAEIIELKTSSTQTLKAL